MAWRFISLSFLLVFASATKSSYYWNCHNGVMDIGCGSILVLSFFIFLGGNRELDCVDHGIGISRCSLKEQGRKAELNPGCFNELDHSNNTRVYCRLDCEESDEATVLQKVPRWNHVCNTGFTYHLERRRYDWYLWRSGDCLVTTISFQVRCGFPADPRQFYIQNPHLLDFDDLQSTTPKDIRL